MYGFIYIYRPNSDDFIDMYSNRETGPSNLRIKLSAPSQVVAIHNIMLTLQTFRIGQIVVLRTT